jgi:hypothetical protein
LGKTCDNAVSADDFVADGKNLDRHWRNARALASHNPASYKAKALGAYELHGTRLPTLSFF